MGEVIMDAWEKGSRLDGWSEQFNRELWRTSLEKAGFAMDHGGGALTPLAPLPWGHLNFGIDDSYFLKEREKAYNAEIISDCSDECHTCGTYIDFCSLQKKSHASITSPGPDEQITPAAEGMYGRKPKTVTSITGSTGLYGTRFRIKFGKNGTARFTGHLDMVRIFDRTIRRSGIPIAYSQGFHPHPKISFGPSLPLGMKSIAEYADFSLKNPYANLEAVLKQSFPEGFSIIGIRSIPEKTESLSRVIKFAEYYIRCEVDDVIHSKINTILESESIKGERRTKHGIKTVDLRPGIVEITITDTGNGFTMLLSMEQRKMTKPVEVLKLIFVDNLPDDVTRTEQYADVNDKRVPPLEVIGKFKEM